MCACGFKWGNDLSIQSIIVGKVPHKKYPMKEINIEIGAQSLYWYRVCVNAGHSNAFNIKEGKTAIPAEVRHSNVF